MLTEYCGDGKIEGPEDCDDGATSTPTPATTPAVTSACSNLAYRLACAGFG
ncbi:MAG: hypothetical protein ABUL62_07615 [Myxococcales bacterium]